MSILEKLEEIANAAFKNVKVFDPSIFNDEVANKTEWKSLANGGSNFKSNKLLELSSTQLMYKPTLMAYIFPMVFIGMFIAGAIMIAFTFAKQYGYIAYIGALVFTVVPIFAGFFILRSSVKARVFDKREAIFYKGKKPSFRDYNKITKNQCPLNKIYAIQLIKKHITSSSSGSSSTQTYYEMNLVLTDTFRINVIVGSDSYYVRNDAKKIAAFLNVPVWDAI